MPHTPYDEIYTSPKTPGHVLDTFAKLRRNLKIVGDFANNLEDGLIVEGVAGEALTAGEFVYVSASNTFTKARADNASTVEAVGVVLASALNGAAVRVQMTGIVTITAWALTAGSRYYLSAAVAGGKTTTAPSTATQYVKVMGRAITSEKMSLQIDQGILL